MNAYAKLVLLAGLGLAGSAHAVTNGNFGAGLSGWDAIGDTSVQGGRALLTTASLSSEDVASNFSGNGAVGTIFPDELSGFFGRDPGAFDLPENFAFAFEGSALRQGLVANAGDTLSFNWQVYTSDSFLTDYAFVMIDGQRIDLGSVATATAAGAFGSFALQSGIANFNYTFTQSGAHTIGFGVVDVDDVTGVSALAVGNVQVAAVPEPESYAMFLAGLGLVGALARRRRA